MSRQHVQKFMDFVVRHLLAWLFAVPLAILFLKTTAPDTPVLQTMAYTAIFLAAMSLLFWNRLCLLVTLAILSVVLFVFRTPVKEAMETIAEFFIWAALHVTGWQAMNYEYEEAFHLAVSAAMAAGAWLTALRFRIPLLALALSLTIAGHAYFYGEPDLIAWMVPLLAGVYLVAVQTSVRKQRQSLVSSPAVPRSVLALASIPLVFAIALLPYATLPQDTSRYRSSAVIRLVDDLTDLMSFQVGTTPTREAFSIGSFGYYPDQGKLGGSITQSMQPVLAVVSSRPALLRGTILDTYTGERWLTTALLEDSRFDGLFAVQKAAQETAFNLDLPDRTAWPPESLEGSFYDTESFTLRMLTNTGSVLFTPGRVLQVDSVDTAGLIPYFNSAGELYIQRSLRVRDSYRVDAQVLRTGAAVFQPMVKQVYSTAGESSGDIDDYLSVNLFLPPEFPKILWQLAEEITAGLQDPYEKAMAIRSYLQRTCQYSLTVPDVPDGVDFVDWFLQTKIGYCTYFASAMTVLARCAGIPARYVEGFAMSSDAVRELDDDLLEFRVLGRDAHAWTEIHIPGTGWITVDSTPGYNQNTSDPSDPSVTPEPDPITEMPEDPSVTPAPSQGDRDSIFANAMFRRVFLLSLAAIIIIGGTLYYRRRAIWFKRGRMVDRLGSGVQALESYWTSSTRMLRYIGYPSAVSDTAYGYVDRLAEIESGIYGQDLREGLRWLADRHVAVAYGEYEPAAEDLKQAENIHRMIRKLFIGRRGRWRYYLYDLPFGHIVI